MIELCNIASDRIAELDVINKTTISSAVSNLSNPQQTRIIVTDPNTRILYDSWEDDTLDGKYLLYPEIVKSLEGNNVFYWTYSDGVMLSHAATPVSSYETQIGCVYMTEHDAEQGALIYSLQKNILMISITLGFVVIIFSLAFSSVQTRRLRKIMTSIRIVRDGDYTHKLNLSGHDELNLLSNEFNDLIARLQISESKRNRFVSDASHELKTPLASIKLLSDSILQNDMDSETIKEFVGDIGAEAERLNRMSEKLLALSRIDSMPSNSAEITNVVPTIDRVVRMLTPTANKNRISIETIYSQDPTILILEDDLYQVVFNLVENGIKYNTADGKLKILLTVADNNAIIKISDTGMGIPQEALEHIFERFYRVDKARSRSTGGSGLGLSIVRNIVKRNNGEIQVESIVNSGTTVSVSFPIFEIGDDIK